ncbi:MAG: hypothetical protein ACI9JD_004175, partial [Rhodococcus sp. (in: high G+C Gram-positive bacteria)]
GSDPRLHLFFAVWEKCEFSCVSVLCKTTESS